MSSFLARPVASAPTPPPDYIRQQLYWQQQQQQHNVASLSQNYGVVTGTIERLENAINSAQKNLSDSDYYELQNRLYKLKQDASLELSRGADASSQVGPAQSLESEIANRIRESSAQYGNKKSMLENLSVRVEAVLNTKSERLAPEVLDSYRSQLADFKSRCAAALASSDEAQINKLMGEGNELESSIRSRAMFGMGRGHLTFTREEEPKAKSEDKKDESSASHITETKSTSATASAPIKGPKKPPVPIHKLIEQIENELMEFHDKHQLGSFDIDSFSEKLLGIKRNVQVMMGKTGRLSLRQEAVIREELESLHQEITDRVLGKN